MSSGVGRSIFLAGRARQLPRNLSLRRCHARVQRERDRLVDLTELRLHPGGAAHGRQQHTVRQQRATEACAASKDVGPGRSFISGEGAMVGFTMRAAQAAVECACPFLRRELYARPVSWS